MVALTGALVRRAATPLLTDFVVGAISDRLAGKSFALRQSGAPLVTTLVVKSKDARIAASGPAAASAGFGDPTVGGAALELVNPTTGESVLFPLPASGWTYRAASGFVGASYQYNDRNGTFGPCRAVSVRSSKSLAISCRGTGVAFSLDEATEGSLGVRLTLGTGVAGEGYRYCLRFGGTVVADEPGRFKATAAPAPADCPGAS